MKYLFIVFTLVSAIATAQERFELVSNLKSGQSIPKDYYGNAFGCSEKNLSPSLEWKNEPAETKSFAITFYDKSAPTGSGFWLYVLIDIPANVHKIELGDLTERRIPQGAAESITDAGKPGFFGPCPPVCAQS
jgi:Raf kinase inhibitor-like YbhB/YbcL family protein